MTSHRNWQLLLQAAGMLKPLLGDLVFVGGCTTTLLITDEAAAEVRTMQDVDAIAEVASYPEYLALSWRLRDVGFAEDKSRVRRFVIGATAM